MSQTSDLLWSSIDQILVTEAWKICQEMLGYGATDNRFYRDALTYLWNTNSSIPKGRVLENKYDVAPQIKPAHHASNRSSSSSSSSSVYNTPYPTSVNPNMIPSSTSSGSSTVPYSMPSNPSAMPYTASLNSNAAPCATSSGYNAVPYATSWDPNANLYLETLGRNPVFNQPSSMSSMVFNLPPSNFNFADFGEIGEAETIATTALAALSSSMVEFPGFFDPGDAPSSNGNW
ncbi:hypothetical protein V8C37DRAFT_176747 [Trichoderma ceciliae]